MVTVAGRKIGLKALRKVFLRLLLGLVILILLLATSLLLAPTRGIWLGLGLDVALRSLPGEVQGDWSWPRFSRIEGRHVLWTVPGAGGAGIDTLAVVESLALEFDLRALRAHDLLLKELELRAEYLDLPGIMAHQQGDTAAAAAPDTAAGLPFLREGCVPQLPSAGIDRLDLTIARLRFPEAGEAADIVLRGSGSLLAGDRPNLVLREAGGRAASRATPPWHIDLKSLRSAVGFDPVSRTVILDSLVANVSAVGLAADTLQVAAGLLVLHAAGSWQGGEWNIDSGLRFQTAVPAPLQNPLPGIEIREFSGHLGLRGQGTAAEAELAVELDLDPSEDVKRGRLSAIMVGVLQPEPNLRRVEVNELDLQWRRTVLQAAGRWADGKVDGRVLVDLQDLELPAMLAPDLLAGVWGGLKLEAQVSGPSTDPRIEGTVAASGGVASIWAMPGAVEVAARLRPDFPRDDFHRAELDLDAGVQGSLQDLQVDLRVDLGRTPWLDKGLLAASARLSPRDRTLDHLDLDSLTVGLRGAEFTASGKLDTTRVDLAAGLSMSGTELLDLIVPEALPQADLGLDASVRLAGPWRDLGGQGAVTGHLATADFEVPEFRATVAGTSKQVRAEISARGGVRLGTVTVDSLAAEWSGCPDPAGSLPAGDFACRVKAPRISGWLRGSAAGDSVRTATIDTLVFEASGQVIRSAGPTTLQVGPGSRDFTISDLRLQGDPGSFDLAGHNRAGSLALAASTDLLLTREWLDTLFPSPFWSAGGGVDLAVQGNVELSAEGTAADQEPKFQGRSELRLIPRNEEPPARLQVDFHLARGDTPGLLADLSFAVGPTPLVAGSLIWPGRIDPQSGRWLPAEDAQGKIEIPEQDLPLSFFNRYLPGEVSLEGGLTVGAGLAVARADSAGTPLTSGTVKGLVRTRDLRVNLPNRSRVELAGQIDLQGELIDPRLAGEITVTSGLFNLPEMQRTLHPVTGPSSLWASAVAAVTDSAGIAAEPLWSGDISPDQPAPYLPDLDLHVIIPGNFKVIGYGLETELAGDVRVSRGWDEEGRPAPVLRGRIQVLEGTLHALNRVFEVERGEFHLEGRIPVDPTVNLVMATEIDGTVIRIRVTGTSLQPKIVLESEPEMIQADIMAFVLFGRPLNDLNTDQRGSLQQEQTPAQQLRQNLQGLALVFGAAGIQNKVSGKVGVDQVQIGSDTAGGSTLVLGKFINPRLLLKYNQSLERSGTYFMTLEYTLSRLFKLVSTYGQGEENSGLELRWLRRY